MSEGKRGKRIWITTILLIIAGKAQKAGEESQPMQAAEQIPWEGTGISHAESTEESQHKFQEELEGYRIPHTDQVLQAAGTAKGQVSQGLDDEDPDIRYQMSHPCHFLMYIDNTRAIETYDYRNVNTNIPPDGQEAVDIDRNRWLAYAADTILDRYIREYGGKDTLYTVRWGADELPEDCRDLCAFEICGEGDRIKVIYSHMTWMVNVTIENLDGALPRPEEYRHYNDAADICNSRDLYYNGDEKVYCKVIDPGHAGEVQRFRNIDHSADDAPDEVSGADDSDMIYYIADQAIDRYIRDFKGVDGMYRVSLSKKESVPFHGNTYEIQAECGNALLLINYSDDSWVAGMEAQDEELDIGVAEQEDINTAGQRTKLKKLNLAVNKYLNLKPIAGLTNLEELDLSVGTENGVDLSPIGELTQFKKLNMHEVNRQRHEVSYFLKNLKELEDLSVGRFRIENLSFLREMTKLKELWVSYVEDADLSYLENAGMPEEYLGLQGYHVRNTEALAKAEKLRSVELWEMERDPDKRGSINMETFSRMQELRRMTIVRLRVEDLAPIAGLQNLEKITLVDTGIADIQCLASLPNLKELNIYGENAEQLKEQAEKYLTNVQSIYIDEKISEQMYNF